MSHESFRDDAPAYALGILDPAERLAFAAHVALCPECAAEVRSFSLVIDALAHSAPARMPPLGLRESLVRLVRLQPGPGAQASGAGPAEAGPHVRSDGRTTWAWLAAAAAILVAIGASGYAMRQEIVIAGLQTRLAQAQTRLEQALFRASAADRVVADAQRVVFDARAGLAVAAAADVARIELAGQPAAAQASARAMWSRSRGMVFSALNLPPLAQGTVYQVWVVTADAPVSAGLLLPDSTGAGLAYFSTAPDIGAPVAVAVTLEPAGGVPAPTGPRYLMGTPGV